MDSRPAKVSSPGIISFASEVKIFATPAASRPFTASTRVLRCAFSALRGSSSADIKDGEKRTKIKKCASETLRPYQFSVLAPCRSADLRVCCIADVPVGWPSLPQGTSLGVLHPAGLETCDTADSEVCATLSTYRPPRPPTCL